ncbi:membrane protein implicated in regulation of membrane protease activity [Sedimentibacter acidaminivorans]|jgi:membrane protein implicated in regulation of membrane protease activity|uniref:Membrane protein implicated in regulation of membrane protease activity n=1 Tax=Sedimentibacter acidaminivorans TaxID=913099 RepID=A0ABS4GF16_9FIRM|nr:NfeD family protein [Sedimentibacter acidaminivorans]MBP1926244.1 membrane protein implicated in regulation of membrane protease activity [Sedimentibacter acidaminivorans]
MDYIGWAWLFVIVVCIVIEATTMGLTTIWFGIGAIVAWITSGLGFRLEVQIFVFLVVSILCLVLTRPIAVKKLKIGKIRTNADSIIGECVKVITTINNINNEGTVKARGQIWSARSFNDEVIEKDEIVCVKEITGVRLIVERKK